jgi:hypothetical protein
MEVIQKENIFQTDSEIVKSELHKPNYLIEYNSSISKNNVEYCIVYFSSNNIYFPNNEATFKKDIIDKNKFEWYGSRLKIGSKHIFIRDIQKQWYLHGINHEVNSIEKLKEFLLIETKGYRVIMLGSSSGGFAASLFGSLLNVEHIISFNGQFQVLDLLKTSNESINPIIFRDKDNSAVNKYFSIKPYLNKPNKIFYFFSNRSEWDKINKKHIEDLNINIISFKTDHHGIPFPKSALPYVINMSFESMLQWNKKIFNPILFSFKYGGFKSTMTILLEKLFNKFKS